MPLNLVLSIDTLAFCNFEIEKGSKYCFFFVFYLAGAMDSCSVLEQIKEQITAAKEEAFSRKDILERVEKWSTACEEEAWLEEYDRVCNMIDLTINLI